MNRLSAEARTSVIRCLIEGSSIRSTVRMTGIAKKTVMRLLGEVGLFCMEYQDASFRNLNCHRMQVDEMWSFVYAKAKNVAAESIAFGPIANGLRLGVAFGSDPSQPTLPKPTLRVIFQNVGPVQDFPIGHQTGKGPSYDHMKFVVTAPDGKEQVGLHRGVYFPITGLVLPLSVRLNAGEIHELEIPLRDIILPFPSDVMLDALIKQGYSVRVQFEMWATPSETLPSETLIGTLSSAEISMGH